MTTALDIAAYIIAKRGETDTMKLQKLVYYAQAWSLVWDEKPLFKDPIEAWAAGPVVRKLFNAHRGRFKVRKGDIKGDPGALSDVQRETVDAVLRSYGEKPAHWLSELSHREDPWRDARRDVPPGAASKVVITHAAMRDYYGSLTTAEATPVRDMRAK